MKCVSTDNKINRKQPIKAHYRRTANTLQTTNQDDDNESEFVQHIVVKPSLIRYCHKQSGSTAYRLQARPALMGPGLQLTAMHRPGLPFNGRHPRDPCDHYSFTDLRHVAVKKI